MSHKPRIYLNRILCLLPLFFSTYSYGEVQVIYEKPKTPQQEHIKVLLEATDTVSTTVSFINQSFNLADKITITFGNDEWDYYENNTIHISYQALANQQTRINHTLHNFHRELHNDVLLDNLMHTLLHEFAHTLIEKKHIPILGNHEIAADNLATVLLLNFFEEGAIISTSAAELFYLEGKGTLRYRKEDFWGEHPLSIQRYYQVLCYVYGHNNGQNLFAKKMADFDEERTDSCTYDYQLLEKDWIKTITPFLKEK